jgi:hypothetical protein
MGHFSSSYDEARSRFRQLLQKAGGRLHVLDLTARGPSGENLTIDIGWFGAESPEKVLVHSSGIHGVEGFAGSAIQLHLLDHLPQIPGDAALIVTHILNPFGMAWLRRVNENNVDLNRNFLADGKYKGAPPLYGAIDSFLNPKSPSARDFVLLKAAALLARHGAATLLQTVGGGQYEFPQGLFFGGKKLEEGLKKYHRFLQERLATTKRVLGIDVHTGLGQFSRDMLIVEPEHVDGLRRVFDERVISSQPKRLPAYRIRGGHHELLSDAAPHSSVRFLMQEFGTYNPLKVFHALREENRWHHFGEGTIDHFTKGALKRVFCPDSEKWRSAVLLRGREVFERALTAVANETG